MFTVYVLKKKDGKSEAVQAGPKTHDLERAKRRCLRLKGYVVDERNRMKAQAITSEGPYFIKQNVGSGEDVCV